jgi:hypothetical protein
MNITTFIQVRATDLRRSRALLTFEQNQREVYREVLIAGDLSQDDVGRANKQLGAFQVSWQYMYFETAHSDRIKSFAQTWTLLPYGTSSPEQVAFAYFNETVYFPQPSSSQFIPGGSGLGVFHANETAAVKGSPNNSLAWLTNENTPDNGLGVLLR